MSFSQCGYFKAALKKTKEEPCSNCKQKEKFVEESMRILESEEADR